MSRAATVYVCSEDATEVVGTADVVECYLESDDPAIILRGVMFDAERVLSSQVRVLQHDIEYYKKARDEAVRGVDPQAWVALESSLEWLRGRVEYWKNRAEEGASAEDIREQAQELGVEPTALQEAVLNMGITCEVLEITEAEELEQLIDGHINIGGVTPQSLAEYLTLHGVKVGEA